MLKLTIKKLRLSAVCIPLIYAPAAVAADKPNNFRVEEITIGQIQKSILNKETTCTKIVKAYLERIKSYGGICVKYDAPDLVTPLGKPIQLRALTPIEHAGQLNAYSNLNIRGQRSETDLTDQDPDKPDALETAAALDKQFARTGKLSGPLHCVVAAIKDQYDTFDMRTTDGSYTAFADDRPPRDSEVVARLRKAGAIIIGKSNMGEYASAPRSTYGGQVCNPYATDREVGASSSGSAAAVSANLASIAISEESLGSVLDPAKKAGVVGFVPTYGLISRAGAWRANLLRERVGPHTRTVADAARLLDVLVGYDQRDPVTAVSIGKAPRGGFAAYANKKDLKGKRIAVIREFAVEFTPADRDSIRLTNQAIKELQAAGAEVLESINMRDIQLFGAKDDPNIPNLSPSIQDVIVELLPTLEPGLDKVSRNKTAFSWPAGSAPIQFVHDVHFDRALFPSEINIRSLNVTPLGEYNEQKFVLDRYLRERGDKNIQSLDDLIKKTIAIYDGKNPPANAGKTLDTTGQSAHLFRKLALNQILLKVFADNRIDALVFPHQTIPSSIIGAPTEPEVEDRPYRGWNAISDVSGFPAVVVPAGFTEEVYDRDPSSPSNYLPPKKVALPFGLTFMARPFDEATLLEVASGYEFKTRHRRQPGEFGPLKK